MSFKSSLYSSSPYETLKVENENGGAAFSNTGDPRVDYFSLVVRGSPKEKIESILEKCWETDKLDTIKLIFNKRDCRQDEEGNGGSGEKEIFLISMIWLRNKNYKSFDKNFEHIPFYGSFKDWCRLCEKENDVKWLAAKHFASQLEKDKQSMLNGGGNEVSLAAKYAPSVNSHYDKVCQLAGFIAIELGLGQNWQVSYRKKYMSPLREHINIVEREMCARNWENIEYSKVPSHAMKLYKKAFKKHSPDSFDEWLSQVATGNSKINAGQLQPHEISKGYLTGESLWNFNCNSGPDPLIEEQWKALLSKVDSQYSFENAVIIPDFSGSMDGTPLVVSATLGCLVAKLAKPPFDNLVISFSNEPTFHDLTGKETLYDCLKSFSDSGCSQGMNTNLYKTFDIMINRAKKAKVKSSDFPTVMFIITDMQFDAATTEYSYFGGYRQNSIENEKPILERVDELFRNSLYERPNIVFWNVRDVDNSAGTINDPKLALVSGFSTSTFANLLKGKDLTPYSVLRETLDCGRYDRLRV